MGRMGHAVTAWASWVRIGWAVYGLLLSDYNGEMQKLLLMSEMQTWYMQYKHMGNRLGEAIEGLAETAELTRIKHQILPKVLP